MASDFLKILQEIRGTNAPEVEYTDGIYWELTQKLINNNPGIYGDIKAIHSALGGRDFQEDYTDFVSKYTGFVPKYDDFIVKYADILVKWQESIDNAAATSADRNITQLTKWEAEADKRTADSYATEPEDTFVKVWVSNGDGTFSSTDTTEYSSLHHKVKAEIAEASIAPHYAAIEAVSANEANVNKVATIDTDVTTVSLNDTNVTTVATNIADINTVATDIANIDTVAADIANVDTVSTNISNVNIVGADIALGAGTNSSTDSAILNALNNANTAITKANEAAASAASINANDLIHTQSSGLANVGYTKVEADAAFAKLNGDNTQTFKVANAVNADEAVSKGQLLGLFGEGVPYTDPQAYGANAVATIYPDGTIIGSTEHGKYVKYANGNLDMVLYKYWSGLTLTQNTWYYSKAHTTNNLTGEFDMKFPLSNIVNRGYYSFMAVTGREGVDNDDTEQRPRRPYHYDWIMFRDLTTTGNYLQIWRTYTMGRWK